MSVRCPCLHYHFSAALARCFNKMMSLYMSTTLINFLPLLSILLVLASRSEQSTELQFLYNTNLYDPWTSEVWPSLQPGYFKHVYNTISLLKNISLVLLFVGSLFIQKPAIIFIGYPIKMNCCHAKLH